MNPHQLTAEQQQMLKIARILGQGAAILDLPADVKTAAMNKQAFDLSSIGQSLSQMDPDTLKYLLTGVGGLAGAGIGGLVGGGRGAAIGGLLGAGGGYFAGGNTDWMGRLKEWFTQHSGQQQPATPVPGGPGAPLQLSGGAALPPNHGADGAMRLGAPVPGAPPSTGHLGLRTNI